MIIRYKRIFNNNDVRASFVVSLYLLRIVAIDFNYYVFKDENILLSGFVNVLVVTIFFLAIPIFFKRKYIKTFLILEAFVAVVFLISQMMGYAYPDDFVSTYIHIALFYLPISVVAYAVFDRSKLLSALHMVALMSTPLIIYMTFVSYTRIGKQYNMELGYVILFPLLIIIANYLISKKWYDMVCIVLSMFLIIFVGSRGPLVCVMVFFSLYLCCAIQIPLRKKMVYILLIAFLGIIVLMFSDFLINILIQISNLLGFHSRTLELMLENKLTNSSGRNVLNRYYLNNLAEHPLTGFGVMGHWIEGVEYPHNYLLELIYSFGYPLGIIAFIITIIIIIRGMKAVSQQEFNTNLVFISMCMSLMFSNTFLRTWYFFVCLALCISTYHKKEKYIEKRLKYGKS